MRHGQFTSSCCVVDAQRVTRLINAIKAVGRANAGANIVLAPFDDFAHYMRVGHMGAGHSDHIQQTSLHRVSCCCHVGNAGSVEGWHTRGLADFTCEIEVGGGPHALNRDHVGHGRIGMNAPFDNVQEIHLTCRGNTFGNLQAFVMRNATLLDLISRIAQANYELYNNALHWSEATKTGQASGH